MKDFWKATKKKAKKTSKYLTGYDWFGIPITVNYDGDDTYKTFFGFICTFMVIILMIFYVYQSTSQLINREEPDRAFYKMTNSRSKEE